MSRKELEPSDVTFIVDTREQNPFDFQPMGLKLIQGTLKTGDYSVSGLENIITCERKSLPDLLQCIGQERKRFDDEMQRILAYPHRLLIIEATWREIEAGMWRSKVTPSSVRGSLLGWMAAGIPIMFAMDHKTSAGMTAQWLFISARRRWRECVSMCETLKIDTTKGKENVQQV